MFQDRSNSWTGRIFALSLALSMLGAGGLLHLTHHLPGDEDFEAPWECSQCKIAENSIGDLDGLAVCFEPFGACELLTSHAESEDPFSEDLESTSPRAPPILV